MGEAACRLSPTNHQTFEVSEGQVKQSWLGSLTCWLRGILFERLSVKLEYEELERPRCVGGMRATLHIEPGPAEAAKRRLMGVTRHAALVNTLARPPEIAIRSA